MNLNEQETRLLSDPTIRLIPLTQGQFAIIDATDFEWLNQWKWHAAKAPESDKFYVRRQVRVEGRARAIQMHRVILGLEGVPTSENRWGDHINRNTLDNRRKNLRIVTPSQNHYNVGKPSNNTSGFKGVSWQKSTQKWTARICFEGKHVFLGSFATAERAYAMYCNAAARFHGKHADLRTPLFAELKPYRMR